jgi:hypothetical protein
MDPRLIGYNKRRQQERRSRRWQLQEAYVTAYLSHGAITAIAKRAGVSRSTISRDVQAFWRAYWERRRARNAEPLRLDG